MGIRGNVLTNQLAPPALPGPFMLNIGPPGPDGARSASARCRRVCRCRSIPWRRCLRPTSTTTTQANLGDAWKAAQDPQTWTELRRRLTARRCWRELRSGRRARASPPITAVRICSISLISARSARARARRLTGTGYIWLTMKPWRRGYRDALAPAGSAQRTGQHRLPRDGSRE